MFPAVPYSRYIIGSLPWYSVLIVTGMLVAMLLCGREEKRLKLPEDTVIDLALLVLPMGVIGARLYYVAFAWEAFSADPLAILRVWEGGLAIYGGIIGGLLAVLIIAWRKKLRPLMLMDMIVPTLALAQAIGRWGNFLNMEAYCAPITDPRWQFFPIGVVIPTGDGYVWHMATFFYESMLNLTVFAVLWFIIRRHRKYVGETTYWYALLYGTGRCLIEGLRTDSLMLGPLRVSQLLSLLLAGAAAILLVLSAIHNRKKTEG